MNKRNPSRSLKNPDYSTDPLFSQQKTKNSTARTEIAHKPETLGSSLYPLTSIISFNNKLGTHFPQINRI